MRAQIPDDARKKHDDVTRLCAILREWKAQELTEVSRSAKIEVVDKGLFCGQYARGAARWRR
jgi:hypothetical protein